MADSSFVRRRFFILLLLLGGVVLTGCRTYGGYDTEPKTYTQIQETIHLLEQELDRAESDLRRLETAAEAADSLRPLAERYSALVSRHQALLDEHRNQVEGLSPGSSYRTLHRVYGAMVADQRLLQRQYTRTVRKVWATTRNTDIPRKSTRMPSRYSITPINFPRVRFRGPITMAEALQGEDGTPGLQVEETVEGEE